MSNRLAFRVDASSIVGIGMGHLERCLSLAEIFRRQGFSPLFILNSYEDAAIFNKVNDANFTGYSIRNNEEAASLIQRFDVDILIVDLPHFTEEYFKDLFNENIFTVIISDRIELAQFAYKYCNLFCGAAPVFCESKQKTYYIGEKYIILNEIFKKYHDKDKKNREKASDILITQGGSDPFNLMTKTVRALESIKDRVRLTLIAGAAIKPEHFEDLRKELRDKYDSNNYIVKRNISSNEMAKEMFDADIAIVSAGNTMYESLCIGTPTITICNLKRQNQFAKFFEENNTIINLGIKDTIQEKEILNAATQLLGDIELRKKMSASGKKQIDGNGIARVIKIIKEAKLK